MPKKTEKKQTKESIEKLALPEGISAKLEPSAISISGKGISVTRKFDPAAVKIEQQGNELLFKVSGKSTRNKQAKLGSVIAHVKNAFKGMNTPFVKKLSIVYAHFPVTIEVKGNQVAIKNFLGEKVPRTANVVGATKVESKGQDITVTGTSKEDVGQTANNLVRATYIKGKDRRIFQDGIYYSL